ncbi:MAG: ABC transporter ATP-binding protein [Actinobacteria bacterium]|nr:ABC transporter ATP-binding protein [Actinomycetota bacterium]
MANVELIGVSKRYGRNSVVDQVSLAVEQGEFVSLLGPSGCGKTTTLRMIAGFIPPSEGEVRISGKRMNEIPPHRRDTGMVFQQYALFPHMTVAENVAFGLKMRNIKGAEIKRRAQEALDLVQLSGLETRMPRELSGGQQQRVAVARALAIRPQVLLLDEPLSNLDAKLRAETRVELRRIQKETGITAIFVTHDQEEALIVSDRIAVMNEGRLVQIGSPHEIYNEPATRFVADFIGKTNFLHGRVEQGRFITGSGFVLPARGTVASGEATLSIRPERISIGAVPEAVGWQAEVERVIYMGDRSEIVVRLGPDRLSVVVPNAEMLPSELDEGETVYVTIRPDDCRIFAGEAA